MMRSTAWVGFVATLFGLASLPAAADNGSGSYSGGSFSIVSAVGQPLSLAGAPIAGTNATLSYSCPVTSFTPSTYQVNWTCAGGSLAITSSDGSLSFNGTMLSGSMVETASGGGKGGNTKYYYQLYGTYGGTVSVAGVSQYAFGSLSQVVQTTSPVSSAPVSGASFGWNSGYSPLVVGDAANARLLGADNLTGSNLVSYGSVGSGRGQFGAIAGLARDASNRIYVVDSALNRIVRIDNLSGANWTAFGTSGGGVGQFNHPTGITVDASGRIWVADAGNNRIVSFTDLTGAGWTSFGSAGTGNNQFTAPGAVALDAQGRIYVADTGNNRLVRFDDLQGTNWVALSEVLIDPYGYPFTAPVGVTLNAAEQIYVALGNGFFVRVDDMTGTNPMVSDFGAAIGALAGDASGTQYLAGAFTPPLAQVLDGLGTGYFATSLGLSALTPSAVLATATTSPPPAAPALSVSTLAFGNQNVGEQSATQAVTLTNLGGTSLALQPVAVGANFVLANSCPASLPGGASCTVGVGFLPTTTGPLSGKLTFTSTSPHPVETVALSGNGTVPQAVVLPLQLSFAPQAVGTTSGPQLVTLRNPGTGPLTLAGITPSAGFSQSSNCPQVLAPGAGCTLQVTFSPAATGTQSGTLTLADDATPSGAQQVVALTGTGVASAPSFALTPESLLFTDQQVGVASAAETLTLTNATAAKVAIGALSVAAPFAATSKCGTSLKANGSCTIAVTFAPTASGPASGTLTISVAGQPVAATLNGNGVPASSTPSLSVSPAAVDFGAQPWGDTIKRSVTVTNPTGAPVGLRSATLTQGPGFTIAKNGCPAQIAAATSCTVSIQFKPTKSIAVYNSTLRVVESSGATTDVPVTGQN